MQEGFQKQERNILEDAEIREVYEKLYLIKRTGWVQREVENPENVGEHTDALVELVDLWVKELGIENPEKLKNMLRIHDWPEIINGDENIALLVGEEYQKAKDNKFQKEKIALTEICRPLGKLGEEIFNLWISFEEKKDYDSQIGHELDKMQAILKAFEYELKGEKVSIKEFIDNAFEKKQITHPFLLNEILKLEYKLKEMKK